MFNYNLLKYHKFKYLCIKESKCTLNDCLLHLDLSNYNFILYDWALIFIK